MFFAVAFGLLKHLNPRTCSCVIFTSVHFLCIYLDCFFSQTMKWAIHTLNCTNVWSYDFHSSHWWIFHGGHWFQVALERLNKNYWWKCQWLHCYEVSLFRLLYSCCFERMDEADLNEEMWIKWYKFTPVSQLSFYKSILKNKNTIQPQPRFSQVLGQIGGF